MVGLLRSDTRGWEIFAREDFMKVPKSTPLFGVVLPWGGENKFGLYKKPNSTSLEKLDRNTFLL